jgi:hypothetical protein
MRVAALVRTPGKNYAIVAVMISFQQNTDFRFDGFYGETA